MFGRKKKIKKSLEEINLRMIKIMRGEILSPLVNMDLIEIETELFKVRELLKIGDREHFFKDWDLDTVDKEFKKRGWKIFEQKTLNT